MAGELGATDNNPQAMNKGFIMHNVVLLDGYNAATMGLIEQPRWNLLAEEHGNKHRRKTRAYKRQGEFQVATSWASGAGTVG